MLPIRRGHVRLNTPCGRVARDNLQISPSKLTRASFRSASTTTTRPAAKDGALSEMSTYRRLVLYGALGITLVTSFYGAQVITALSKVSSLDEHAPDLQTQKDVVARYDEIANSFDSDVNFSEWLMGILELRKLLARMCQGNVLEVSCGTGRNLGYFDLDSAKEDNTPSVTSLTFIDLSEPMVQVCRRKWAALHGMRSLQTGYWKQKPIRFIACSALDDMPMAPDGSKYDTILQTMGLCSTPVPEDLLKNLVGHLNLENQDARILLLEHGRSTHDWLNRVLDNTADKHAESYGCWYNRDIDDIVKHAAESAGLEVVGAKRRHLGTTFVYELKATAKASRTSRQDVPVGSIAKKESIHHQAWRQLFGN